MEDKWTWYGARGNAYAFEIRQPFEALPNGGAVYLFAMRPSGLSSLVRTALYIDKATDLAVRLCRHERWRDALVLGANEIHVLPIHNPNIRAFVERDLMLALQPSLNVVAVY